MKSSAVGQPPVAPIQPGIVMVIEPKTAPRPLVAPMIEIPARRVESES